MKKVKEVSGLIHRPYNVQVELVRGCNFACHFCAIHTVPKRKDFMTVKVAKEISKELSVFDPIRIEFAMRSEPTLHPKLSLFTKIFRMYNPLSQITLTTNGSKLTRDLAKKFFKNGGNIIIIDCYAKKSYDVYIKRLEGLTKIYDLYNDDFNPWHKHKSDTKVIVMVRDFGANINGEMKARKLINQAGNMDFKKSEKYGLKPLLESQDRKCTHPFREMAFFSNGNTSICCRDWSEKFITYNIMDKEKHKNLEDYWYNNEVLNKSRLLLQNKDRDFGICKFCDFHGGMRIGLLPKLPELNEKEKNKIKQSFKKEKNLVNKKIEKERKEEGIVWKNNKYTFEV